MAGVQPDAVVDALVVGLRAYGVAATADVRSTGHGVWLVSLDAEPDGIDVEVAEHADRVRVLWSGGTVDDASLGDALNYAARAAGVVDRG